MSARYLILAGLLCLVAGCGGAANGPPPPATQAGPDGGHGWTGITRPQEVIAARLELMEHIEELMEPIDTLQVTNLKDISNTAQLRTSAEVIGAMLTALPHLFPPTTNLYDPKSLTPATIALPAIWADFDNFYALAGLSKQAADRMAEAQGAEALRAASLGLRASCDGCHAAYLRKYLPPVVLESDREFDFQAALPRH